MIGVERDGLDRAYDWNDLRHLVRIHDTLNGQPITVALMDDSITFRAWTGSSDSVGTLDPPGSDPIDPTWDIIRKALADSITKDPPVEIPTSQEFWHSWRTFHPNTTRYTPK